MSPEPSPKPWYDKGLRFECSACGNCCRSHGEYAYVYLAPADVRAIARHLELSEAAFLARHCREEDGYICLRMDDPACPFLTTEQRCRIYPVRPKQCASWPFWQENLQRANWRESVQTTCPGTGRGPLHSRAEIEGSARETEDWYEGDAGR